MTADGRPSTEVAVPVRFPWLPKGVAEPTPEDIQTWARLHANLAEARDEVAAIRARYDAFRTWLLDEAQAVVDQHADLPDSAPCPPRLQTLLEVIHRLPEG